MATLFSSSDDEDAGPSFGRSAYADTYNKLRRKEELLKLKNKYGEALDQHSESSSSDDDDDDVSFTEEFEKNFFKTLSCLKKKDPKIYDKDVRFFNNDEPETVTKQTNKKEKAVTIRDYNRELILKKGGKIDDDDENSKRPHSPSYVEEQKQIKNMLSKSVIDNDDDNNDKLGGLFMKKNKTKDEEEEEENTYREWLSGQSKHLDDLHDENELKPLKDYWTNPKLDEGEAFLRDYVLNQRFKEKVDKRTPTYDEIVNQSDDNLSEDERQVGQQAEFEHKFNFRFEEPDQEFIKQYPRTLEHSIRRKDDKRSKKRMEIKERKADEKMRKKEEINQLKALKLKELQEKIIKLKEITGNNQLAFDTEDIEGEFDPDAHDRRMNELFNDNYYGDIADTEKPEFPELDEELEIENWETWDAERENDAEPHCEDENFNMDCDFNPNRASEKSLIDDLKNTMEGPSKRKRKRKNKLAQALTQEKPIFDPNKIDKTLSQYLDEYYKLDCEDVIGDMPCRYKYREVPACDYGLTMEEILLADDKELNRWYPLKKTLQCRSAHLDLNDQKVYSKKAANIKLKMQILPSLFKSQEENDEISAEENDGEGVATPKKKKNNKKKKKPVEIISKPDDVIENDTEHKKEKSKTKKRKLTLDESDVITNNDSKSDIVPKKDKSLSKKQKRDSGVKDIVSNEEIVLENGLKNNVQVESESEKKPKKSKNRKISDNIAETVLENDSKSKKEKTFDVVQIKHTPEKKSKNKKESKILDNNAETVSEINSKSKKTKAPKVTQIESVPEEKSEKVKDAKDGKIESTQNVVVNMSRRRRKRDAAKSLNLGVSKINPGRIEKKPKMNKPHKLANHNNFKVTDTMDSLTDERLQAYGLNPKKYKNFMKFKKY